MMNMFGKKKPKPEMTVSIKEVSPTSPSNSGASVVAEKPVDTSPQTITEPVSDLPEEVREALEEVFSSMNAFGLADERDILSSGAINKNLLLSILVELKRCRLVLGEVKVVLEGFK